MPSEPASPRHSIALADSLLRDLKLSQIRALLLLYAHGTVNNAAVEAKDSYSSLVSQLQALNAWFVKNAGVAVVTVNARRVELTDNGRWLATTLDSLKPLFVSALEGLQSSSIALAVPCTSDCLPDLARFIAEAPPEPQRANFTPVSEVTAQFNPLSAADLLQPVLSLGSVYMSGERLALPSYVEVLVLRDHPIVAIANEDPSDPDRLQLEGEAVSIHSILAARTKVLTSEGGVIYDFLLDNAPKVADGLRNGSHVAVSSLHYGLKCLAARVVPRGVMLVHGVEEALKSGSARYPLLENLQCVALLESTPTENRAITGMFFNHRAAESCASQVREAYETLWRVACAQSGRI